MSFNLYGTQYGGWIVDLDLIPEGSTIISAGIGEDISFDLQLIKSCKCNIVGIDPTHKSHRFIQSQTGLYNFQLIKKALCAVDDDTVAIFKNKRPDYVSESTLPSHESVDNSDFHMCRTISLGTLFKIYTDISVLKLDIEGSEYDVLLNLVEIPKTVKQLCVEFHHFCCSKTVADTLKVIRHLRTLGFKHYREKPASGKLRELTFYGD